MHQGLLIGLPESGKTTFVAALWHVIASQEIEGALALEILDAPTDHLNELRGRWLRFEETFRTSSSAENIATIKIRAHDGNPTTEIVIPDLAGESIERAWSNAGGRQASKNSCAVLLACCFSFTRRTYASRGQSQTRSRLLERMRDHTPALSHLKNQQQAIGARMR